MVSVAEWFRRRSVEPSTRVQFSPDTPKILCPHCERPLGDEHDEGHCRRRMSRRFFFGALAGGLVAAGAAAKTAPGIVDALKNRPIWTAAWHKVGVDAAVHGAEWTDVRSVIMNVVLDANFTDDEVRKLLGVPHGTVGGYMATWSTIKKE